MTDTSQELLPVSRPRWLEMIRRGCGYTCPFLDVISGTCERHGPTEGDRIVERVTKGFADDLRRIMGGNHG